MVVFLWVTFLYQADFYKLDKSIYNVTTKGVLKSVTPNTYISLENEGNQQEIYSYTLNFDYLLNGKIKNSETDLKHTSSVISFINRVSPLDTFIVRYNKDDISMLAIDIHATY